MSVDVGPIAKDPMWSLQVLVFESPLFAVGAVSNPQGALPSTAKWDSLWLGLSFNVTLLEAREDASLMFAVMEVGCGASSRCRFIIICITDSFGMHSET